MIFVIEVKSVSDDGRHSDSKLFRQGLKEKGLLFRALKRYFYLSHEPSFKIGGDNGDRIRGLDIDSVVC